MKEAKNVSHFPSEKCDDKNCPYHGNIKLRGRIFTGTVVSSKSRKTVTIEWPRKIFIPKYERYEKRKTRLKVHNSPCIDAKEGDYVRIMETRPLSKTKHFVVIEKIGESEYYAKKKEIEKEKMEVIEKKTREKEEE